MSYPDRMRSLYIDDIPGIQYISIKVQDLQKEHIKNQYTGKDMMNKFLDLQEILKNVWAETIFLVNFPHNFHVGF